MNKTVQSLAASGVLVVVAGVAILGQTNFVQDSWKEIWYRPSAEMAAIEAELDLTATGERIFAATNPVLEEKEDFNEHCDSHSQEISLLGCYTNGQIYVYRITDENLADSNKVTLVHELLHAAWERMGKRERQEVEELLQQVATENAEWAETELSAYDEAERIEEVWTRAGTKLKSLPEELERVYAKYLEERGKIVAFYENYQAPFRELTEKNQKLEAEILEIKAEIAEEREEYLKKAAALDAEIDEFNVCAGQTGCFQNTAVFQRKRQALMERKTQLDAERETLNAKIDENNARVEEYIKNQAALGDLNNAMNSNIIEKEEE